VRRFSPDSAIDAAHCELGLACHQHAKPTTLAATWRWRYAAKSPPYEDAQSVAGDQVMVDAVRRAKRVHTRKRRDPPASINLIRRFSGRDLGSSWAL
jgi:hypothetical protein